MLAAVATLAVFLFIHLDVRLHDGIHCENNNVGVGGAHSYLQ